MIDLSMLIGNPELAKNLKIEVSAEDLTNYGKYIAEHTIEEVMKLKLTEPEDYLSPQKFADVLGISLVTLWTWDKKKITRPLYLGKRKYYRRSDLEKITSHE